jgi:hypothetical protein
LPDVIRRIVAAAIVLLSPLLLAAADPPGDIGACRGHGTAPGTVPDLLSAEGWIGEQGTSAVWRLRFAAPLEVPDPRMPAFRIDILVRDPTIPTVSFAYRGLHYRDLNRIIRFDATSTEQPLELLFIPEGGAAPFDPPAIDGGTLTLQVPGRLLLGEVGDDLGKVDLTEMRWTVVVRDMDTCDFLAADDGRPSRPLETTPPAEVAGLAPANPVAASDASGTRTTAFVLVGVIVGLLVLAAGLVAAARRRRTTFQP